MGVPLEARGQVDGTAPDLLHVLQGLFREVETNVHAFVAVSEQQLPAVAEVTVTCTVCSALDLALKTVVSVPPSASTLTSFVF